MTSGRRSVLYLVWIACVVLTRLPQLLSPDLVPDPDEAVLGLMAKRLAAGERLDVFFAGQSYGLSLLEVGLAALHFHVFGTSTLALKVAMLLIWMAGGALMIAAVDRIGGRRAAWLCMVLLTACPGWSEWSMRARGGYLTAFLLSGLILHQYSRLRADRNRHPILTAVLGAAAALVPFAQPVWTPVILSFLALLFHQRRRLSDLAGFAVGAGPVVLLLVLALAFEPEPIWSPGIADPTDVARTLLSLPGDVIISLSGVYLFGLDFSTSPWIKLGGVLWSTALLYVIVRAAFGPRDDASLRYATLLSLIGMLVLYVVVSRGERPYRYLLPLHQLVVVFLAVELSRRGRLATLAAGVLIASGLIALLETPRCSFGATRSSTGVTLSTALDRLADHLLARGIRHAYATDGLCQYTLPFQTDKRIRARGWAIRDRLPEEARAVDRALAEGKRTALIGPPGPGAVLFDRLCRMGIALPEGTEAIGGFFFVVPDPTPEFLGACRFVLHPMP